MQHIIDNSNQTTHIYKSKLRRLRPLHIGNCVPGKKEIGVCQVTKGAAASTPGRTVNCRKPLATFVSPHLNRKRKPLTN